MKAVLGNPTLLKHVFDALSWIVDEIQIRVESSGMKLKALDRSHITFVDLDLQKDFFDEFECNEPIKLNLDTEEMLKVLKRVKSDDTLTLTSDDNNLILIFEGNGVKRTFKIRLIDIDYEPPSPPDLEWGAEIELPMDLFKTGIKDAEIVGDKIGLKVDSEKFYMAAGGEFGDADLQYIHGEKVDGKYMSIFSLERISSMLKAEKFASEISMCLGNNMPFYLSMINGSGVLSFLLAPRIEQEE